MTDELRAAEGERVPPAPEVEDENEVARIRRLDAEGRGGSGERLADPEIVPPPVHRILSLLATMPPGRETTTVPVADMQELRRWIDGLVAQVKALRAPLTDDETRLACHIYCQHYEEADPNRRLNRGKAMRKAVDQVLADRAERMLPAGLRAISEGGDDGR